MILFADRGIVYHSCFYSLPIANPEPIEFAENGLAFIGWQVTEFEKQIGLKKALIDE